MRPDTHRWQGAEHAKLPEKADRDGRGRQLTCKGTMLTATRVLRTPSQRRLIGPYTCRRAQLIRPCPFHSRLMTSGSSR